MINSTTLNNIKGVFEYYMQIDFQDYIIENVKSYSFEIKSIKNNQVILFIDEGFNDKKYLEHDLISKTIVKVHEPIMDSHDFDIGRLANDDTENCGVFITGDGTKIHVDDDYEYWRTCYLCGTDEKCDVLRKPDGIEEVYGAIKNKFRMCQYYLNQNYSCRAKIEMYLDYIYAIPELKKLPFFQSLYAWISQTNKKNGIEILGFVVIINRNKFEKLLSSFYGSVDSKMILDLCHALRIKRTYSHKTSRSLGKVEYSWSLDDYTKFKQFMNPAPEPQPSIQTNESSPSPTNILIPSNETKDYRSGCYLIQRQNDSIFKRVKIGKGKDVLKRINGEMAYKNCVVISINHVDLNKLSDCENEIIQQFTEHFKLIKESDEGITGNETFEINDLIEAKKLFDSICEKYFV